MNGKLYVYFNKKKYEEEGIKKYYVGQTIYSIEHRAGKNGKNYSKYKNTKFANSIKKWGWEAFEVTILEEGIETFEELNEREKYYVNYYNSYNNGYNSTIDGAGVSGGMYNRKSIPVRCIELNIEFNSIVEAREYMQEKYDLCLKNISKNLNGQISYCGTIYKNNKKIKLHWEYINEEDKEFGNKFKRERSKEELDNLRENMKGNNYAKTSIIYCPELDKTFDSISKAQSYIKEICGVNCSNISATCRGLRETCGTIILNNEKIKLHWKYIKKSR